MAAIGPRTALHELLFVTRFHQAEVPDPIFAPYGELTVEAEEI